MNIYPILLSLVGDQGTARRRLGVCQTIIDRLVQDQVNLQKYQRATEHGEARRSIVSAFELYRKYMDENNQLDYARLEELFL